MRPLQKTILGSRLLLAVVISALASWTSPAWAQQPTPPKTVYIYLFWGDGCPHCALAKPFLESLPAKYPGVVLKSYEIYFNARNQAFFSEMAKKYGLEQLAVPTIFIGPYYLQGYAKELDPDIEKAVSYCLQQGCIDAGEGITILAPTHTPAPAGPPQQTPAANATLSSPAPPPGQISATAPAIVPQSLNQGRELEIPLIGKVNLELQSITFSTVLIALVDGFNPCSVWVLTMLLALTLHTGSRKKVLLIGLVFLTVTAAIYALFIAGLFSVVKIASFYGWIQAVVALVALFFALVNIKDYFWYKEGISFTIADDKKPGIFKRMRTVMDASQSLWGLVSATVVLAAGVSLVEFSCTAGFPVVWTNLLLAQNVGGAAFAALLLLYMVIYQLDELAIFLSAVISLKASRLEEKHGRLLKLVGGMLMLTLSIVMLVHPALMNSLGSSLLIFGAAFAATLLVWLVDRVLLSKFRGQPAKRHKKNAARRT